MMGMIGLAGMPGSGKTLIASKLRDSYGYEVVRLSSLLSEAREDPNDPSTTISRWEASTRLRESLGAAFLAERAWTQVCDSPKAYFVIEGVRTLAECEYLAARGRFFLAVFQRPSPLRQKRLARTASTLYRRNEAAMIELDAHELALGLGAVLAVADHMIFSTAPEDELPAECVQAASKIHTAAQAAFAEGLPGTAGDGYSSLLAILRTRRRCP